jgi:hypothetical protein
LFDLKGAEMMEIGPRCDVPGATTFFRNSPFHWGYFLADTAILISSTGVCIYVMIQYRNQLSSITEILMGAVILGMLFLWSAALRAHRQIHDLFQTGGIPDPDSGSPLETALKVAASMIHLGLFYAFLFVGLIVMQFDRILTRR